MNYSPEISDQVLAFFQQKSVLSDAIRQQLQTIARQKNCTAVEVLLEMKPELVQVVEKIVRSSSAPLPHSVPLPGERGATASPLPPLASEERVATPSAPASRSQWELIDGDANEQLERILGGAIDMGASDIHIDLDEMDHKLVSRIRFRIDGICRDMVIDPRKSIYEGITSRLKTLASCRLDESRIPQDGRVPFVHKGKNYEFRISFNPVTKKNEQLEKVVLRQMADVNKCNLQILGIHPYNLQFFREAIDLPYGFNIVTGPTGSGKTTTLYSVLQEINRQEKNVCSIEEPIEAEIDRVNQTQVRHDIGLDFARVLRALLRQDPDVIMVGEMRDLETAETALDAALTGHVVWSTLHTNSAVASISRLIQMGIKDYMAANAIAFIIAQRLTQRVCSACRVPHPGAEAVLHDTIIPAFANACDAVKKELEKMLDKATIFKPRRDGNACARCEGMGFKGRVGVMEILKMNEGLREIILRDEGNEARLQHEAEASGMMTMRQYGYLKVLAGETTVEAVEAVVR